MVKRVGNGAMGALMEANWDGAPTRLRLSTMSGRMPDSQKGSVGKLMTLSMLMTKVSAQLMVLSMMQNALSRIDRYSDHTNLNGTKLSQKRWMAFSSERIRHEPPVHRYEKKT